MKKQYVIIKIGGSYTIKQKINSGIFGVGIYRNKDLEKVKQYAVENNMNVTAIGDIYEVYDGNTMKNTFNSCKWAVSYKIDKETQDDRKTKVTVVALFSTPCNAEDFINNCLPASTRERFFIIRIDELEACEDADKVQKIEFPFPSMYAKVID